MGMKFKVGDEVAETILVTEETVNKFAEVSGDKNPVHIDPEFAKTTRFGQRIAHGMLSAAFISRVLGMQLGPGGIYLSQEMKFVNPVFIGDSLTVTLKVREINERRGMGYIDTIVTNQRGETVVKGQALIMDASKVSKN